MYNAYKTYPCPYFVNTSMYNPNIMYNAYRTHPCPYCVNTSMYNSDFSNHFTNQYIPFTDEMEYDSRFDFSQSVMDNSLIELKDYGPEPFVVNIEEATKQNNNYRTALWTGDHLQVTLMSINVGDDIGLEVHPTLDQFIRIEEGQGLVQMGDRKDRLNYQRKVYDDFAIMIPAGKWHNVINTGNKPLKLYAIYAPPEHPHGTVHKTKAIAQAAEDH
ncbi:cupin domain-containing protein [Clostridium sp. MSJ-11]|uniref:Cupin domain-containing protein n=1 Tax=Clostridium mobile TaxID=2841512 RepID=A0ABS6EFW5_9CLOT|nr:cupin domain-containing protein [Clostridium mobile]MBU5483294.1 cupin domain-containing protein [Clostridium mobile]